MAKSSFESASHDLIESFLELLIAQTTATAPKILEKSIDRKMFEKHIRNKLARVLKNGGVIRTRRDSKGKIASGFLAYPGSSVGGLKLPFENWTFDLYADPRPKKADREWFKFELKRIRPIFGPRAEAFIDPGLRSLIPSFRKQGIYPVGLVLQGEVEIARRELKKAYPELDLKRLPENYSIHPMRPRHFDAYFKIIRDEFTRNPQFGWFVTSPSFLKMVRKELKQSVKAEIPRAWVIVRDGQVVGGFEYSRSGAWKTIERASMGLNFSRSIQRKGLAKYAYLTAFESMKKENIRTFQGCTSQPGVLKLSAIMKRRLIAIEMLASAKPVFANGYFDAWIERFGA